MLKHKLRQVRAVLVQWDVSALGKGRNAVLVKFLNALKSSSLNRGREPSIFLKLRLHRELRSPITSSNAMPAEAVQL